MEKAEVVDSAEESESEVFAVSAVQSEDRRGRIGGAPVGNRARHLDECVCGVRKN